MRRSNPIEWTSGCLHSPATEAGARSCAAANCIRKRREPPRILLARRLPAQSSIPKGTAMVTLRQFSSTLPLGEYGCRIMAGSGAGPMFRQSGCGIESRTGQSAATM
jgi:hypothetical protein